ncbi:MAG: nuclease-related domain-containing protein [Candidatus Dormibacteraceae bacterium]
MEPEESTGSFKRLRLRYEGRCVICGRELAKGTEALYYQATRTVRCVECPTSEAGPEALPLDLGIAGSSAHGEYERRKAAREARVKGRVGNFLGEVVLAIAGEAQSTTAWERGSIGEQKLAAALAGIDGVQILNDRRVPGTRGNIDHIVIAPAGVFVVDAKRYAGLIRIRDRGNLFKRDDRLYVGSRDCSKLAENMAWQVKAVERALESTGVDLASLPIEPVLCFIDGEWPMLLPPESFKGVRLEGKRSIRKLMVRNQTLDAQQIAKLTRTLSVALAPKADDMTPPE